MRVSLGVRLPLAVAAWLAVALRLSTSVSVCEPLSEPVGEPDRVTVCVGDRVGLRLEVDVPEGLPAWLRLHDTV